MLYLNIIPTCKYRFPISPHLLFTCCIRNALKTCSRRTLDLLNSYYSWAAAATMHFLFARYVNLNVRNYNMQNESEKDEIYLKTRSRWLVFVSMRKSNLRNSHEINDVQKIFTSVGVFTFVVVFMVSRNVICLVRLNKTVGSLVLHWSKRERKNFWNVMMFNSFKCCINFISRFTIADTTFLSSVIR